MRPPRGKRILHCAVPGCPNTRPGERAGLEVLNAGWLPFDDWLCLLHWSIVPESLRFLYRAAKETLFVSQNERDALITVDLWKKCKEAAIARAGRK